MATVSIPLTTQQQEESPLIKIDSEDDESPPIHDISRGNDEQDIGGDHSVSSANEFTDHSSPYESGPRPSFAGDSSPARSNEEFQLTLKKILKDKIAELKESYSNESNMRDEIKSLNDELLLWISKWKEMKARKDRYKVAKKSMSIVNEQLLEQKEHQKLKILELKAKLSEARRTTQLQIST